MRNYTLSFALCALCAAAGAAQPVSIKTPETSRLFVRHVDPASGVESWLLKPGVFSFHQQGWYFTMKSMTDDGRFILFWARDPEFEPDGKTHKRNRLQTTALIDMATETIVDLKVKPQIPFLDVKTDQLWYFRQGPEGRFVCRRDLLVDPMKEIVLCPVPEALLKGVTKVHYLSTHPTLTTDRKKMFIAAHLDDRYEQGCINLETGAWESWGTTPFYANHDQLNPVRDDIAMVAWEKCASTEDAKAYKAKTGWYPRMWLVYPDGRREMQPSRIPNRNYATHEHWAEDGKGFYWCASGVHYQDLATGKQETICPWRAAHATMTADNKLVTFDMSVDRWYRGCQWQVGFWNRAAGRGVYIHAFRPMLCADDGKWHDHPDPHPAFVCNDRYVLCTMNGEDHRMNLSLTPVAPLVARTSVDPDSFFRDMPEAARPDAVLGRVAGTVGQKKASKPLPETDAGLACRIEYASPQKGEWHVLMEGFRRKMAERLKEQRADGLWNCKAGKVDLAGSAFTVCALVKGVRHGWLEPDVYGPAARKAWLALAGALDGKASGVPDVQAALVWACEALAEPVDQSVQKK